MDTTTMLLLAATVIVASGLVIGLRRTRAGSLVGGTDATLPVSTEAASGASRVPPGALFALTPYAQVSGLDTPARRPAPTPVREGIQRWTDALGRSGMAALTGSARTVRLAFAPHVQQGLDAGRFALMKASDGQVLAVAVDAGNGQIVGLGRLVPVPSPAAAISAAWQLAAVVTAQHYLHAIDERLAGIEGRLGAIQSWLEDEQYSVLDAAREFLRTWQQVLATTVPAPQERAVAGQRLDTLDDDLSRVMHLLERRLARAMDALEHPAKVPWGAKGVRAAIRKYEESAAERDRLAVAWLDAATLRLACAALRATADLDAGAAAVRVAEIGKAVDRLDGRLGDLRGRLSQRTGELRATFVGPARARNLRAEAWERVKDDPLLGAMGAWRDGTELLQWRLQADRGGSVLELEIDDEGEVCQVWSIEAGPGQGRA